jgi:EmrB/QacA subfamily drug resistance transporter
MATSAVSSAPAGPVPTSESHGPLTHKQIVTILVGLMMGMFLAALDQTIVSSAMRVIADDLHDLSGQAWVVTAYLITSTIVTPLYGKLSDIYGRKRFFTAAIVIFLFGSILCTFATSMPMLAGFRAVQGLGAGGLFSLALAIIGDIVPPRERAKYQGYFLAVFGTSSVLGPVVGGFFAGQATILGVTGWRWVFLVNLPIGLAALFVVDRTLHLRHARLDHRIDFGGAAALTVGLVPLLLVAEQGREWGWGSGRSLACYGLGLIGLIAFFLVERAMGAEALLPLSLFRNKTVGVASIASVVLGMGMFGGLASLPLYLQIVKGATPTVAGLMLLPMTLGMMSGSIISGQMISRTGQYRQFPIIGCGLLIGSLFAFHYVGADTALWLTMIVMLFFGLGLGFNMQPLTLAVQNAVHPRGRCLPVDPLLRGAEPDPDRVRQDRSDPRVPGGAEESPGAHGQPAGQYRLHPESSPGTDRWRQWRSGEPAERLLVHPAARPATGQTLPGRLLPGDGPGVPDRLGSHDHRVCRRVVPAARRAPQRLGL